MIEEPNNRTGEQENTEQPNTEQRQRTMTTPGQRQQADSTSAYRLPARLRTGIEQDRTFGRTIQDHRTAY